MGEAIAGTEGGGHGERGRRATAVRRTTSPLSRRTSAERRATPRSREGDGAGAGSGERRRCDESSGGVEDLGADPAAAVTVCAAMRGVLLGDRGRARCADFAGPSGGASAPPRDSIIAPHVVARALAARFSARCAEPPG